MPCPSARVLRSLRSREVTPSTCRSQKRSQILLNRLRRKRRAPPLRKFASHAPNLRKQHECAVYVASLSLLKKPLAVRRQGKKEPQRVHEPTQNRLARNGIRSGGGFGGRRAHRRAFSFR